MKIGGREGEVYTHERGERPSLQAIEVFFEPGQNDNNNARTHTHVAAVAWPWQGLLLTPRPDS